MSLKNRVRRLERVKFCQWESDNFEEAVLGGQKKRVIDWEDGIQSIVSFEDGNLVLTRL